MFIRFTKHTAKQMIVRGISRSEVENAIRSGSKFIQKPNKIVAGYGYFSVVYKKIGNEYQIITVQPRW